MEKIMKRFLIIVSTILLVLFSLTACAKDITIAIKDNGEVISVQTKTGTTVREVLEQENIKINGKDEIEPSLEAEIIEETAEITIKRYAKVIVKKGVESKEVELVGGTVQSAIDQSGFTIASNEEIDHNADEHLTDGISHN